MKGKDYSHSICDQACKINHLSAKKLPIFFICSLITYKYLYQQNKIPITTAEFNGLSYEIYGNGITHSELKIIVKIYLSVICTYMVDFRRPGHIYG